MTADRNSPVDAAGTPGPTPLVLVTGATGYAGGRLLAALEARGCRLRCMARHPEHLASRVAPTTQVRRGGAASEIRQTAVFDPVGILGLAYWYAVAPLHTMVFRGLLDEIAARAISLSRTPPPPAVETR